MLLTSLGANAAAYTDSVGASGIGHTFSYRIRAYTTVSGGIVYSEYSEIKSVTFN